MPANASVERGQQGFVRDGISHLGTEASQQSLELIHFRLQGIARKGLCAAERA
jgi:hypothetical protein